MNRYYFTLIALCLCLIGSGCTEGESAANSVSTNRPLETTGQSFDQWEASAPVPAESVNESRPGVESSQKRSDASNGVSEEDAASALSDSPQDTEETPEGERKTEETTAEEWETEEATEEAELPPCPANGVGFVTLQGGADNGTLLEYSESVIVEAEHLEPDGCFTHMTLTWTRTEGCALTLNFIPSAEGIWTLQEASIEAGEACGTGGTGAGNATLSQIPLISSSSPPPLRCTVLASPLFVHGTVQLSGETALNINLEGLGVAGMLLSTAVDAGDCGKPYEPCSAQECGEDPLLSLTCGGCEGNTICEGGTCKSVEPVVAFCQRVLDDRAELSEDQWEGSTNSCDPGVMSLDWQERALKSSNLYRWIVGQPPFTLSTQANSSLQECAVMMDAGGSLSHNPSETWPCYKEGGANAAGVSNLAPVPAVEAVDLYMVDPGAGNQTTIGHRRWILSDWIDTTGFGSTNDYSCMKVVAGFGGFGAPKSWIAWPPPGYYPMELHYVAYQTIDDTGWTIQTNGISLKDAAAVVKENGVEKPVASETLLPNYGSAGALKIMPQGWEMQASATYEVTVVGASEPIEYSFEAVDCTGLLSQQ